MSRWCNGFALMFTLLCLGCGGGDPFERAAVEGVVNVDGQPLTDGVILFVPDGNTTGRVARGIIKDGTFKIPASEGPSVGAQKVEITSTKKTGKTISMEGVDTEEVIQFIPDQYNTNTNLTADIKSGTMTLPPFELKSKIERKGTVLPGGVVP